MKKLLATLLILSLTFLTLVSCGEPEVQNEETKIRVGYMAGPTGMGMAKLIHDNGGVNGNEKYAFTKYENTKLATADLLVGNIDVICLPTNEAANYRNTTDDNAVVLAINTLNTLFLLSDENTTVASFADLEGKTVYTCKNGTPKVVLEYLLAAAEINATVATSYDGKEILTPADLGAQIVAGNVSIAVAPEPIVTSSNLQRKQAQKAEYSVDVNLNTVWESESETPLTMGCIVSTKKFVTKYKKSVDAFLGEYEASIDYISTLENLDSAADYVVESGVMAALPAAKSALKNLGSSIDYIDGKDMKTALVAFYKIIKMTAPKDAFYYEK